MGNCVRRSDSQTLNRSSQSHSEFPLPNFHPEIEPSPSSPPLPTPENRHCSTTHSPTPCVRIITPCSSETKRGHVHTLQKTSPEEIGLSFSESPEPSSNPLLQTAVTSLGSQSSTPTTMSPRSRNSSTVSISVSQSPSFSAQVPSTSHLDSQTFLIPSPPFYAAPTPPFRLASPSRPPLPPPVSPPRFPIKPAILLRPVQEEEPETSRSEKLPDGFTYNYEMRDDTLFISSQ